MYTDYLQACRLCPRNCGINRLQGELGFCRAGNNIRLGLVSLHHWEEPCISGTHGSGTIFFSHCNLRCLFCQNHAISQSFTGKEVSVKRLAAIFLEQQQRSAHNINLVTPGHYAPQIVDAIILAKQNRLAVPVIYNTNSYESLATIDLLSGHIDVYLPDLKYYDDQYACRYSAAPGYFRHAAKAIEKMAAQVGEPVFDKDGLICRGVIIRHLALPGLLEDSKKIISYIYHTFGNSVYISLMNQYTPLYRALGHPELGRRLTPADYEALIEYALSLGVENGFIQEGGTVSESFVPAFNMKGV